MHLKVPSIDCKRLDLHLVDENTGTICRKPELVVCMDANKRVIVGYYVDAVPHKQITNQVAAE